MAEESPRMKALRDYLVASPQDSERKWAEYVALASDLAGFLNPKHGPAVVTPASSTMPSTASLHVPSSIVLTGELHEPAASTSSPTFASTTTPVVTKDDLSPGARRMYDYLIGATDDLHEPAAATSSPTSVPAISATRSTAPSVRAAMSSLDSTPASVPAELDAVHDTVDANASDPTPTTCLLDYPSRDFNSSTTPMNTGGSVSEHCCSKHENAASSSTQTSAPDLSHARSTTANFLTSGTIFTTSTAATHVCAATLTPPSPVVPSASTAALPATVSADFMGPAVSDLLEGGDNLTLHSPWPRPGYVNMCKDIPHALVLNGFVLESTQLMLWAGKNPWPPPSPNKSTTCRKSNPHGTMDTKLISGDWRVLETVELKLSAALNVVIFVPGVQSARLQSTVLKWPDPFYYDTHLLIAITNVDMKLDLLLARRATHTECHWHCLANLYRFPLSTVWATPYCGMLISSPEAWVLLNCHSARVQIQWIIAVLRFTSSSVVRKYLSFHIFLAILNGEAEVQQQCSCPGVLDAVRKGWIHCLNLQGITQYSVLMSWSISETLLQSGLGFHATGNIRFFCCALLQWKNAWTINLLSLQFWSQYCSAGRESLHGCSNFQWTIAWLLSYHFPLPTLQTRKIYSARLSSWKDAMLVVNQLILMSCTIDVWNSFLIELVLDGENSLCLADHFIQRDSELMQWTFPWFSGCPVLKNCLGVFAAGSDVHTFMRLQFAIKRNLGSQIELPSNSKIELKPWPSWELFSCIAVVSRYLLGAFHILASLVFILKGICSRSTHYLEEYSLDAIFAKLRTLTVLHVEKFYWLLGLHSSCDQFITEGATVYDSQYTACVILLMRQNYTALYKEPVFRVIVVALVEPCSSCDVPDHGNKWLMLWSTTDNKAMILQFQQAINPCESLPPAKPHTDCDTGILLLAQGWLEVLPCGFLTVQSYSMVQVSAYGLRERSFRDSVKSCVDDTMLERYTPCYAQRWMNINLLQASIGFYFNEYSNLCGFELLHWENASPVDSECSATISARIVQVFLLLSWDPGMGAFPSFCDRDFEQVQGVAQVHISLDYYLHYACHFDNFYRYDANLDSAGCHRERQVQWNPGGSTWHRLGVKPNFKEGGLSATSPLVHSWAGGRATTRGPGLPEGTHNHYYKYEREGQKPFGLELDGNGGFGRGSAGRV